MKVSSDLVFVGCFQFNASGPPLYLQSYNTYIYVRILNHIYCLSFILNNHETYEYFAICRYIIIIIASAPRYSYS